MRSDFGPDPQDKTPSEFSAKIALPIQFEIHPPNLNFLPKYLMSLFDAL